jgi:putative alpha-1,2-mannosidase
MRLAKALFLIASHTPTAFAANKSPAAADVLSYVDPLIGTINGGNVFAGATLPYGLAKAVADVDGQNTGGFGMDDSNVVGFSVLHDSGSGGNPSLGNFPLFPQVCPDDQDLNSCKFPIDARKVGYDLESVVAEPGYFSLKLDSGIRADITVSEHAGLFRFTFPEDSGRPLILLDLTDLWKSRQNASISVDADSGRLSGNGTFLPSFGAGSYVAYYCVDFFGADVSETGVWRNNRAGTDPKDMFMTRGFNLFYAEGGGFVRFDPPSNGIVTARVGVSFISSEQACRSAENEIPDPLEGFDGLVEAAKEAWRQKLSPISVDETGVTEDLLTSFWSGVYRNMISPQNYTGENPYWDSGIPYFDSFYW